MAHYHSPLVVVCDLRVSPAGLSEVEAVVAAARLEHAGWAAESMRLPRHRSSTAMLTSLLCTAMFHAVEINNDETTTMHYNCIAVMGVTVIDRESLNSVCKTVADISSTDILCRVLGSASCSLALSIFVHKRVRKGSISTSASAQLVGNAKITVGKLTAC